VRPHVFASDGPGSAYAQGSSADGDGVDELPFGPPDASLARYVGPTVPALLDVLRAEATQRP